MDHDPHDPRLPDPLIAEFSRLYRAEPAVPPEVDRAILNRARAHLAGRGRLRLLLRTAGAAAAVAAVVAMVVLLHFGQRPGAPLAAVAGDVNGDGVVDIRDAMLLARRLESGQPAAQDFNHDGVT